MKAAVIQSLPQAGVTSKSAAITSDSEANKKMFGTLFTGSLNTSEQSKVVEEPISEEQGIINELLAFLEKDTLSELEGIQNTLLKAEIESEMDTAELIQVSVKDVQALLELISGFKEVELLPDLELNLDECASNPEQVLTINLLDLYTLIKQVDIADDGEWSGSKAAGMAEAVKLAKIQVLAADTKGMKTEDIPLTKEIKQLLENISGRLEKLSGTNIEEKKKNEPIMEKNRRISLDALRSTYTRILSEEGDSVDKSKQVTMKTSDGNQSSTLPFQMSKLEQYVLATEKNGQPVDQEQFIKQFEKILSKANFTGANGMQKLMIKLNPEHLGALRIEIIQKDSGLTARIMATTSKGKEMLETQLQGLKQSFAGQGIQVEKIEIAQTISLQERFTPKDSDASQQQRNQPKEQKSEDNDESLNEFSERFEEALINFKV